MGLRKAPIQYIPEGLFKGRKRLEHEAVLSCTSISPFVTLQPPNFNAPQFPTFTLIIHFCSSRTPRLSLGYYFPLSGIRLERKGWKDVLPIWRAGGWTWDNLVWRQRIKDFFDLVRLPTGADRWWAIGILRFHSHSQTANVLASSRPWTCVSHVKNKPWIFISTTVIIV